MQIKGVYVVTSEDFVSGRTHEQVTEAAIRGGASVVQLRDKTSDDRRVLQAALAIREITRDTGVLFIVNNRVDIALASDADGVNLGQSDMPIEHARRLLGPGKIIGISVDTEDEVKRAVQSGADYLGYGPVFATSTKLDAGPVTGLEGMKRACGLGVPVVAIGGINQENIASVRKAGADSAAVVSAVAAAPDMAAATKRLVELFRDVAPQRSQRTQR